MDGPTSLLKVSVSWIFKVLIECFYFSATHILLFWLTWWPFLRLLSLFIRRDVGSLSSFPALMLPEEYLPSKGLFRVGTLLAAQPGARWPVHMQWLLLAPCAAVSGVLSWQLRSQDSGVHVNYAQVSYLPWRSHRRSQLESLSGLEACHHLWQWILPLAWAPSPASCAGWATTLKHLAH